MLVVPPIGDRGDSPQLTSPAAAAPVVVALRKLLRVRERFMVSILPLSGYQNVTHQASRLLIRPQSAQEWKSDEGIR